MSFCAINSDLKYEIVRFSADGGALRWRLEAMEFGIGNAEFGKLKQRAERIEQSVRKK